MPNWVCNHLTIQGESSLDVFRSLLIENKDNHYGYDFDFNKIKPMPEELNIISGSVTDRCAKLYVNSVMDADDAYIKYAKLFTEACGRDFYMTESEQSQCIQDLLLYKDHPSEELLFSNKEDIYAYGKRALDNYAEYGAKDWYDWRWANWGTKWNACNSQVNDYGTPDVYFDTAWSPVSELILELSKLHPDCVFEYEYAEEQAGYIAGKLKFQGGELIDGCTYESDSKEAYETYFSLWGGEDHFRFNEKTGTYEYIDDEAEM